MENTTVGREGGRAELSPQQPHSSPSPPFLCSFVNEVHLRKENGIRERDACVDFSQERAALIFYLIRLLGVEVHCFPRL